MKEFHSKIVGTTFTNGQEVLKRFVNSGKVPLLKLVPEPENEFDNKAIAVYLQEGERLGYLPRETAQGVFDDIALGAKFEVTVSELTGNVDKNVGCNILVKELP